MQVVEYENEIARFRSRDYRQKFDKKHVSEEMKKILKIGKPEGI